MYNMYRMYNSHQDPCIIAYSGLRVLSSFLCNPADKPTNKRTWVKT